MPLYDTNGSVNTIHELFYDNDGSTITKLGKIYDNDGNTNSLLYEPLEPFVIVGSIPNYTGTYYAKRPYANVSVASASSTSSNWSVDIASVSGASYVEGCIASTNDKVPTSKYSKCTIVWTHSGGSAEVYGVAYFGLAVSQYLSYTDTSYKYIRGSFLANKYIMKFGASETTTDVIDISDITEDYYIALVASTGGKGSPSYRGTASTASIILS